jgi:hypothetical protein
MRVDLAHGRCRTCGSALDITGATQDALFVECCECADSYELETDALGGGCMTYWLTMMAKRPVGGGDET